MVLDDQPRQYWIYANTWSSMLLPLPLEDDNQIYIRTCFTVKLDMNKVKLDRIEYYRICKELLDLCVSFCKDKHNFRIYLMTYIIVWTNINWIKQDWWTIDGAPPWLTKKMERCPFILTNDKLIHDKTKKNSKRN